MTLEKIEIGNKLIAEFMEIPKCQRCDNCGSYQYGPGVIFHPKEMKYDVSWDWLMPVVEKINKNYEGFLLKFGNVNSYVKAFDNHKNPTVPTQVNPDMKVALYDSVILFIKYLNDEPTRIQRTRARDQRPK